jgi:hypothetical protein
VYAWSTATPLLALAVYMLTPKAASLSSKVSPGNSTTKNSKNSNGSVTSVVGSVVEVDN